MESCCTQLLSRSYSLVPQPGPWTWPDDSDRTTRRLPGHPFFRIIEEGVAELVDGEHFFDLLAEDVVFEYVITVPGYPRRVEGRQAVAELYRHYGATFSLDRCYDLAVHHDQATNIAVLEYA